MTTIERFHVGHRVNFVTTFKDENGNLADPPNIKAEIIHTTPSGSTTSEVTPTKESTGVYITSVLITGKGEWGVKVTGWDADTDDPGDIDAADYVFVRTKNTPFD